VTGSPKARCKFSVAFSALFCVEMIRRDSKFLI